MEHTRSTVLYIVAFVAVFLLSLAFFLVQPRQLEKRIILFPDVRTGVIIPEYRYIARDSNQSQVVKSLVNAVIAGPQDITLGKVFPDGTEIKAVHAWQGKVLISVSALAQEDSERVVLPPRERFQLLSRTIRQNWPFTGEIAYIIDGVEAVLE